MLENRNPFPILSGYHFSVCPIYIVFESSPSTWLNPPSTWLNPDWIRPRSMKNKDVIEPARPTLWLVHALQTVLHLKKYLSDVQIPRTCIQISQCMYIKQEKLGWITQTNTFFLDAKILAIQLIFLFFYNIKCSFYLIWYSQNIKTGPYKIFLQSMYNHMVGRGRRTVRFLLPYISYSLCQMLPEWN